MIARQNKINKPPASKERLVSVTEAAKRIGVSRTSVRRYIAAGHLTYGVLPGGRRMVTERTVEQFIGMALRGDL